MLLHTLRRKTASTCPDNHLVMIMSLQRKKRKIIKELVTV